MSSSSVGWKRNPGGKSMVSPISIDHHLIVMKRGLREEVLCLDNRIKRGNKELGTERAGALYSSLIFANVKRRGLKVTR